MKSRPISILPLEYPCGLYESYFWTIGCVGYESRSRYFIETFKCNYGISDALVFQNQQVLAFQQNNKAFSEAGFTLVPISDNLNEVRSAIHLMIQRVEESIKTHGDDIVTVLIDISSMTRQVISLLAFELQLWAQRLGCHISCDFVYSAAKFGELPSLSGPIQYNDPVFNQLAGWSSIPGQGCGIILGVGYEPDLALGVIEELEASAVWIYRPKNDEKAYDDAIDEHNRGLFETVPPRNRVRYSITDPYGLFVSLDQLAGLAKQDYRIIIVPFGPKIFALASVLVALSNYPDVGIWRVSGGPNLEPVDRVANGTVVPLRVIF
jgi:hypothetical protein